MNSCASLYQRENAEKCLQTSGVLWLPSFKEHVVILHINKPKSDPFSKPFSKIDSFLSKG